MYYATGSISLTLDAMPDPDSAIVYSYVAQNNDETEIHTGEAIAQLSAFRHNTDKPGSLTISYLSNAEIKTLTDQGNGLLTGDG